MEEHIDRCVKLLLQMFKRVRVFYLRIFPGNVDDNLLGIFLSLKFKATPERKREKYVSLLGFEIPTLSSFRRSFVVVEIFIARTFRLELF